MVFRGVLREEVCLGIDFFLGEEVAETTQFSDSSLFSV